MILDQDPRLGRRLSEYDKALVTGNYFGFLPISPPKVTRRDIELTRDYSGHPHFDATEKASVIRMYTEGNLSSLSHPLAVIYQKPAMRKKLGGYSLHYIGSSSGIAEAILARTALSILLEEGHENLRVDINCMGDRESMNVYERELASHVRKSAGGLSDDLRQSIKEDVFKLWRLDSPEAMRIRETAPSSMAFLSSQSRSHFKEVLEYIEALGIEFRLAPELVGEKNHTSHTIFAIKNTENENDSLAVGYRYSHLARFLGLKKEIHMAGVNIFSTAIEGAKKRIYKKLPKPKFFLIQLGREAKAKTLSLIELLRTHHIPLYHFIGKDKLDSQLSSAESFKVPYLIIVGQREAIDNTVTIRNTITHAQDTVGISSLPAYLKNISL